MIGIGGMGEVYKARDTRLDRVVALKLLRGPLGSDPEFRNRFQREARTVSQLDHPHICPLYDVGEQSGTPFLVMPYLEGETLRARLRRGRPPLEEALGYAVQIADALDKAHRAGVVHRDLKPDNIFLTKAGTKLLDFGLAKKGGTTGVGKVAPEMSTASVSLTARGTLLGTLPYMAPEQLEGREADSRADIFAFGAVLYEMVAGRRAFEGSSEAGLVAAIIGAEPAPMGELAPVVPPQLEHLVRRCLAKDPDDRWQTASDVMRELQWIAHDVAGAPARVPGAARRPRAPRLVTRLLGFAAIALALAGAYLLGTRASPDRVGPGELPVRISVPPPPNTHLSGVQVAFSPDGAHVAYIGLLGQRRQVWVYSLVSGESHALPGTEDARFPFWSPDSRQIAFFTGRDLRRIPVSGGPSQSLAAAPEWSSGSWSDQGVVLFGGPGLPGIFRVGSSGGTPSRVTTVNPARGELLHLQPRFLPGGQRFLYLSRNLRPDLSGVYIRSLDADDAKLLVRTPTNAEYVAPGYLLYVRDSVLLAQRFDLDRLELEGEPLLVAQAVSVNSDNGGSAISVSRDGSLVYHAAVAEKGELKWVDRGGRVRGAVGPQGMFRGVELSPDGRTALVKIRGTEMTLTGDLWVVDLSRGVSSRLTYDAESLDARWSADGKQVFFDSSRSAGRGIYSRRADGTGPEQLVWQTQGRLADVTGERRLLVEEGGTCTIVDLGPPPKAMTFIQSPLSVGCGRFSADGRWLAYTQNEPGHSEVYVLPVPAGSPRIQVSSDSGLEPRWRRDGRELFYLSPAGAMMSVGLAYLPTLRASPPLQLFSTGALTSGPFPQYSVSRDGKQFLMIDPVADPSVEKLIVIAHWRDTLKH